MGYMGGESYHNIPKAIFYLLKGDDKGLQAESSGFKIQSLGFSLKIRVLHIGTSPVDNSVSFRAPGPKVKQTHLGLGFRV